MRNAAAIRIALYRNHRLARQMKNELLWKDDPIGRRRDSVLDLAKGVIGDRLRLDPDGKYYLWFMERWCRSNLDQVMRHANSLLEAQGKPQIEHNPNWLVASTTPINPPAINNTTERTSHDRHHSTRREYSSA